MPTLSELRAAHRQAGAALRAAEDRLGQARDRARDAVGAVAKLEREMIDGSGDDAALTAARSERTKAMTALKALEDELRPAGAPGEDPL